ncbi:unnamed protein product [Cuscuta campestris]|uniref:Uncharacterized protein n=1 Tax=Cuscuta campestris TaxID=132261 RepID=A0A484KNL4_9ASTE|nr:unnamed protein product [Cuscuta campestris]
MSSPAAATPADDEGGHGGRAHSAMKAVVFAIMAGGILWTVVAGYARRTPAGVAAPEGEEDTILKWGRRVFTAALLVPCAALLLVMSLLNCVNAAVPPPVRVRLEKVLFSDVSNRPREQESLWSPLVTV